MRATRPKKLTPKQPIPIFREDQIDLTEDDPQSTVQAVETGVEKAEESVRENSVLPLSEWSCHIT
jgi:enhancer of polycomb-like protein